MFSLLLVLCWPNPDGSVWQCEERQDGRRFDTYMACADAGRVETARARREIPTLEEIMVVCRALPHDGGNDER